MAAMNGHKAVARYLVENGADVNRKEEGDYGNALQAASYQGSENIVRFLVEKGAVSTFKEERLKVHSRRHHTTARRISSDCLSRKAPMSTFKEERNGSIEQQLIQAIGAEITKKELKATNPLTKIKDNKTDIKALGTRAAQSKVTQNVQKHQPKMNTTKLITASKNDWFETTKIEESLLMKDENKNRTPTSAEMEIDEQNITVNPTPLTLEGPLTADNETVLANIEEVRKVQEQNTNLRRDNNKTAA
ncbi:hypothetical protein FPQ18DRAFT_388833 [Pyronema domesticum]|nr:hypothetical protein FPQ18DRAFT_388833 [Pyronema domesticum]